MVNNQEVSSGKSNISYMLIVFLLGTLILELDIYTRAQYGVASLYVLVILASADFLPSKLIFPVSILCLGSAAYISFLENHRNAAHWAVYAAVYFSVFISTAYYGQKRRLRETALDELTTLIGKTYDAILIRDRNDVIVYWNRGAEKLYGWSGRDAKGQNVNSLLKTVFPKTRAVSDLEFLRDDKWEGEVSQMSKEGRHVVILSRWHLQRDADGAPFFTVEANRDITLTQGGGMGFRTLSTDSDDFRTAMLAQMTSTIAHELSQPLSASIINGEACLRWLREGVQNVGEARKAAESVIVSARQAGNVIVRVRKIAEREAVIYEQINLNDLLQRALSFNQDAILRNQIEPHLSLVERLPNVQGNRKLLEKVFDDLLAYAVEKLPNGSSDHLLVVVSKIQLNDCGGTDIVLKIGTPFAVNDFDALAAESRHPDGLANNVIGSPLSVCRFVIESHSWRLDALSNPSHGTAFRIKIPVN